MNYARQSFLSRLRREVLLLDGAMGTLLQAQGLPPGEAPEAFLLARPEAVRRVHRAYVAAGADVILSASFGANPLRLAEHGLEERCREINRLAIQVAREAAGPGVLVAAGLGPSGRLIAPLGEASFAEVEAAYRIQAEALASMDPDLFIIETVFELREMKAIVQAVRSCFDGPLVAQLTFQDDGRTFTGTDALTALTVVEALDVDVVGANCSVGPRQLLRLVQDMAPYAAKPISVEPNAGLPERRGDATVFPGGPDELVECVPGFVAAGAALIGGCCGTDPGFIAALRPVVKAMRPERCDPLPVSRLASATATVLLGPGQPFRLIGERINPSGRKKFREELRAGSLATVRREAVEQTAAGADLLDVNVGVGGGEEGLEARLMAAAVRTVQEAAPGPPLAIDSADVQALAAGLAEAPGKCLVNSVTGEARRLAEVLPLARRWGAGVLGLLVDDRGVPKNTSERIRIAEAIVAACDQAGLPRRDLYLDCVCLPVSAAGDQAEEVLRTIREVQERFGVRTLIGLSNVSFGLPRRELVNRTFLAMAMAAGLTGAIANPLDGELMETAAAGNALLRRDPRFAGFLRLFGGQAPPRRAAPGEVRPLGDLIRQAVIEGDRDAAAELVLRAVQEGQDPLAVNNDHLVPAMEEVGRRFNAKVFFLPQVLAAAEAMQRAFQALRPLLPREGRERGGRVVLATVKGDVHDIGKNILAAVLDTHGFQVTDLGKNVDREEILARAQAEDADLVGLSALMTTTMVEMRLVVEAARQRGLRARFLVGGAVVTPAFAAEIGADGFGSDAMAGLAEAERLMAAIRDARRRVGGLGA